MISMQAQLYLSFSLWIACVFSHPMHAMFEQFKSKFGKLYHTQREHNYRFQIFLNNSAFIRQHNDDPTQTFTLAMNKFGDWTHEEFKSTLRGYDTSNHFFCLVRLYGFLKMNIQG